MTLLHTHAQYIYIVNAKYQKPSVKALVQADFSVYAQAKSLFKSKQEKTWLVSKSSYFVKKKQHFFGIKLLYAIVQWVYIVYAKYRIVSAQAVVQVEFPA